MSRGLDQVYARAMPAPPARIGEDDLVRLSQLYAKHATVTNERGERYETRTWSEIDVAQWQLRQPRARAWFSVPRRPPRRARPRAHRRGDGRGRGGGRARPSRRGGRRCDGGDRRWSHHHARGPARSTSGARVADGRVRVRRGRRRYRDGRLRERPGRRARVRPDRGPRSSPEGDGPRSNHKFGERLLHGRAGGGALLRRSGDASAGARCGRILPNTACRGQARPRGLPRRGRGPLESGPIGGPRRCGAAGGGAVCRDARAPAPR